MACMFSSKHHLAARRGLDPEILARRFDRSGFALNVMQRQPGFRKPVHLQGLFAFSAVRAALLQMVYGVFGARRTIPRTCMTALATASG